MLALCWHIMTIYYALNYASIFDRRLLETMLYLGCASSTFYNVVVVWRPCFVRVMQAVCFGMLLLSGDHAPYASSMLCDDITIRGSCLVNFVCYNYVT